MNSNKKSAIFFVLASLIQSGIGFLTTPIFTRLLTQTEYGELSLFNTWYSIISIIATLSLGAGIFSVGMTKYSENRNEFSASMLLLSSVSTIITFLLMFIVNLWVPIKLFEFSNVLIVLFVFKLFFNIAWIFWLTKSKFENNYLIPFLVVVISSLLSVVISIFAVIYTSTYKVEARLISSSIIPIIISIYLFCKFISNIDKSMLKEHWKFALKFNLPLLLHYLSFSLLSGSDKLMIEQFRGLKEVGIYSIAYTVGSIGTLIWAPINSVLIPSQHKMIEGKKYKENDEFTNRLLIIYSVLIIGLMLVSPEILRIIAPVEYQEAIYIFPPVIAGLFFTALYNIFANIEFYYEKTFSIMIISVMSSVINITLNFIFIPKFGYIAAAYTTLISYLFLGSAHYFNLNRMTKVKLYNGKKIFLISTIVIISNFLILLLYNYAIIRYVIILLYVLILMINYKKIIEIFLGRKEIGNE